MLVLLLASACSNPENHLAEAEESATTPAGDTAEALGDAPDEPEPTVTEESADGLGESGLSDWLFTLDTIHTVDLTISAESEAALASLPYAWARADVSIDGIPTTSIGVRLRGKIGSFRNLSGKPKFKLSFNQFVDDRRFYGLEELSLNNAVVDCSYEKEIVGYRVYEAMGVPSLRSAYARVTVNGADYGLYILLETPDDRWIDRVWERPEGNLYDGKYVWYGGYSYTLLDFGDGVDTQFQLEEGTDVGNADIANVSAALLANQGQPGFYDAMGAVLDWDEYHRMTAVDQFIGHNDGYSMNTNNYRVYFDPSDGKAEIVPWDLDYTFLYDYQWGLSWSDARGNVTNACFRDETCAMAQRAAMGELLTTFEATDWSAFLDDVEALTYTATQTDPRRECAATDVQVYRDYVRSWLLAQPDAMRAWWGL